MDAVFSDVMLTDLDMVDVHGALSMDDIFGVPTPPSSSDASLSPRLSSDEDDSTFCSLDLLDHQPVGMFDGGTLYAPSSKKSLLPRADFLSAPLAAVTVATASAPAHYMPSTNPAIAHAAAAVPARTPMHLAGKRPEDLVGNAKQAKKSAHNLIERRYRNNINDRITELRDLLPAYRSTTISTESKMNKQTVLRKGIEYIKMLEQKNNQLTNEVQQLRTLLSVKPEPQDPIIQYPLSPSASSPTTCFSGSDSMASGSPPPMMPPSPSASYMLANGSRVIMCVLLCGFVVLAPFAPAGTVSREGASASYAPGARVLAEATDMSTPPTASSTIVHMLLSLLQSWLACGFMFLACLLLLFLRDPISDVDMASLNTARDFLKAITAANALGHRSKAKRYAVNGLQHLGYLLPSSRAEGLLAVAWQLCRQLLHRVAIGCWIDRFFAPSEATELTASLFHELHQLQLNDASPLPELAGLYALNLAESAAPTDTSLLARIYAATAVHMELRTSGQCSVLTRLYWLLAKRAFAKGKDTGPCALQWIFEPMGYHFLLHGRWRSGTVRDAFAERLPAGSLEHAGHAFRLSILQRGVDELLKGADPDKCAEIFGELLHWSSNDTGHAWWALLGLAAVAWRTCKGSVAQGLLLKAEQLECRQTATHTIVMATFRAAQALIDNRLDECWRECTEASALLRADGIGGSQLHQTARLVAYQKLLETRIGLFHRAGRHPEPPAAAVTMLAGAQLDVLALTKFKENCVMAEPVLFLYQGILRHLAGGASRQTEHLFNTALKSARRLELVYDEAIILLHSATCLRSFTPPALLQSKLSKAAATFARLQATGPLASARKLMHLMGSERGSPLKPAL